MKIPLVAIIGLPNTGKSTFFNKVLESRKALTYPEAGTTRDRAYGKTSWNALDFFLIDTAGINPNPDSDLEKNVQRQTRIAIEEADMIILMVDGKTDPGSSDFHVAKDLNRSGKPVVIAANKIDARNTKSQTTASAYQKLGLGEPFLLSSINGSGMGDLLDAIVAKLKEHYPAERVEDSNSLKIAFIGKPNVGKSSLINALLKQDRLLVHNKAGTTRSTVEIPFEFNEKKFTLLDTAGIKKKWDQDHDVEAAAAIQAIRTIAQTDVALFVLDASAEITSQDQVIAQQILEQRKPAVILLNKIDLLTQEQQDHLLDILPDYFPQIWFLPVLFVSAKTYAGLDLLLKFAFDASIAAQREIQQEELDSFLDQMMEQHMPGKKDDQRAPKIYNIKQVGSNPPVFKLTVNFPAAIAEAWKKYFEKQFRLRFGFEGTPIEIRYIRKV